MKIINITIIIIVITCITMQVIKNNHDKEMTVLKMKHDKEMSYIGGNND